MFGLLSNKKEYYYTAKWISNDDRSKYAFFRFKILSDDNLYKQDIDNMSGCTGNAVWETKSLIDFQPDDIIIFRGQKFHIKNVDANRKAEPDKECAYMYFKFNGNTPVKLQVRKDG